MGVGGVARPVRVPRSAVRVRPGRHKASGSVGDADARRRPGSYLGFLFRCPSPSPYDPRRGQLHAGRTHGVRRAGAAHKVRAGHLGQADECRSANNTKTRQAPGPPAQPYLVLAAGGEADAGGRKHGINRNRGCVAVRRMVDGHFSKPSNQSGSRMIQLDSLEVGGTIIATAALLIPVFVFLLQWFAKRVLDEAVWPLIKDWWSRRSKASALRRATAVCEHFVERMQIASDYNLLSLLLNKEAHFSSTCIFAIGIFAAMMISMAIAREGFDESKIFTSAMCFGYVAYAYYSDLLHKSYFQFLYRSDSK